MYIDGNLQAHEHADDDEILCLCGTWFPVSEARTIKYWFGTYYYEKCQRCWQIRQKRYAKVLKRRWEQKFMTRLKQNMLSPSTASNFVRFYNSAIGSEKLVKKLASIIDGDDPHTALQAIKLYISMSRMCGVEKQEEFLLERSEERQKTVQHHELYNCPF